MSPVNELIEPGDFFPVFSFFSLFFVDRQTLFIRWLYVCYAKGSKVVSEFEFLRGHFPH